MFFSDGLGIIDIIYGDSLFNLTFWLLFGLGGQTIIGILVLGRKPFWADTCWHILRVQLAVAMVLCVQFFCGSYSDCSREFMVINTLSWVFGNSLFFMAYFTIISTAIWCRYRQSPILKPWHVAGIVASITDLGMVVVMFVVLLVRPYGLFGTKEVERV